MSHVAATTEEAPASQPSAGEPSDPDPIASRSPSRCSSRTHSKNTPLLALAPTGEQTPQDEDIPAIWNVISRAQDVVKDAERLENLTWRHWGSSQRRRRSSSIDTASSASVHTPLEPGPIRDKSAERRSFAGTLKLLVEDDSSFKDWIGDAKKHDHQLSPSHYPADSHHHHHHDPSTSPQQLSVRLPPQTPPAGSSQSQNSPKSAHALTPVPDLEIRLVEPTPVPSRVGSLGGVASERATITRSATQPQVAEVEEEIPTTAEGQKQPRGRKGKGGGFFIQSSPGKASESESPKSQPSPVVAPVTSTTAPPGLNRPTPPSAGESEASCAAVVVNNAKPQKEPRRPVSMATMHGRFHREKRHAAQVIAARNAEDSATAAEDDDNDDNDNDDEWEDDEDDDDEDGWEDETPSDPKPAAQAQPMARQTSRGTQLPAVQLPPPVPALSKKQRAAEKARIEAEREAQRQREMFAKRQIFGNPQGGEGLLTRTFKTGKSMVDLTKAGEEAQAAPPGIRRAPTHANFSTMGQSPTAGPPSLMRSKSTAAMPVQTGVSVTSRRSHNSGHSDEKRGGPEGVEMETSDESDGDDYLASSVVERKLNQLAAKRAAKDSVKEGSKGSNGSGSGSGTGTAGGPNRVPIVPNGNGANQALDEYGIVRPLSPTTRRRTIIMREMSESLRRNIILEREKSSGGVGPHTRPPPSTHMSRLPTSNSAVNLAQYRDGSGRHGPPLSRHNSNFQLSTGAEELRGPELERHNSHPDLIQTRGHYEYARHANSSSGGSRSTSPAHQLSSISPEASRKRNNVLGGGFLRPLTRATDEHGLGRTQSSLSINGHAPGQGHHHAHDRAGPGVHGTQQRSVTLNGPPPTARRGSDRSIAAAHPMVRSSTEGDQKEMERARVRRELARRDDTSYRSHGW